MPTKERPRAWAMLALFVVVAAVGTWADLLTKKYAFDTVGLPGERIPLWVIDGVFGVQTSLNEGALFGMGQGWTFLFAAFSILALLFIFFCLLCGRHWRTSFWSFVLGLISAGILGNLYDRLGLHGILCGSEPVYAVRDWILVMIGDYHWPNFNLADAFIVTGTILIMIAVLFQKGDAGQTH
ncbi:MAG: signal peptidase II [Planctomycetia bacterium]|nr:signal peptidase II [Planctomycetia bacterium]